jgi:hypothetical protein
MDTYKVIFTDENGKGISTQHVKGKNHNDAIANARAPKVYANVTARKKGENSRNKFI